jgi:hypothetical protein
VPLRDLDRFAHTDPADAEPAGGLALGGQPVAGATLEPDGLPDCLDKRAAQESYGRKVLSPDLGPIVFEPAGGSLADGVTSLRR